ncbi:helix-turn-helix domain-containing protein [Aristaeella lactis]|uniref:Helix-turn-helix domain-containing protein n=1 Tax=Aristaeella lactis TaxID=3046383 RepID=A0AC61PL68_9FIRM|nr:helix-turn-helix domain-containing protein [Aristaeella lactis]QUA52193.1 helix-turn-helix domain-containing protein [Aristaeella lactis]SMC58660.1 Helix-turn-helix domain-containing protein [Aristaeella lactis]
MAYITAAEVAKKWNVSQRRIQILCASGRIPGVFKLGAAWAIPENAIKPLDIRKNNGRKIKNSECH